MIELFSANTPNGKKISIMLEEIGYEFKVTKVDIGKDEQFKLDFKKISPFSKIPVIIDHKNNKTIFESGAILIYLGEISGKFYNKDDRTNINQWLMAQMGYIGPMLGQHHQFHHYNPGKSEFGEERYFKISKRIYSEVDEVLSKTKFLAGDEYTIADIERSHGLLDMSGMISEFKILRTYLDGMRKFQKEMVFKKVMPLWIKAKLSQK